MERPADRQLNDLFGTGLSRQFAQARDRRLFSGDDQLPRSVEIGRHYCPHRRCLLAELDDRLVIQTDDGGHASGPLRPHLLHQFSPLAHQPQTICKCERTGRYQGGIFAQTVARSTHRFQPFGIQQSPGGHAVDKNGRLRHRRLPQFLFRAVETELAERKAENLIRFVESGLDRRELGAQIAPHAHVLRCLSGKQKSEFFHLIPPI